MRLIALPGVFRPLSDTRLLAECLRGELRPGAHVADICTGTGLLAVTAAVHGAGAVSATDSSRRAVLNARLNARLNGVRLRALRGDLLEPLGGSSFDLIVSNPPYVPAETDALPSRGAARAWDAGRDGRRLIDRLCDEAPRRLRPGGALLIVQSSVCGEASTCGRLESRGLHTDVPARRRGALGPILAGRAQILEARGVLAPGEREEEILVVRARLPSAGGGYSALSAHPQGGSHGRSHRGSVRS
jgi:release factor glutamine methyltransferase